MDYKTYKKMKEEAKNRQEDYEQDKLIRLQPYQKRRKGNSFFLLLLSMFILLSILFYFVVLRSDIRQIVVVGNVMYTREEIIKASGLGTDMTVLDVFLKPRSSLERYPYIKELDLTYDSINQVRIKVTEKQIVAYMLFQGQYIALDVNGYAIGFEDKVPEGYPLITGMLIDSITVSKKVGMDEKVLRLVVDIKTLSDMYDIVLTEVRFPRNDASEVLAYTHNLKINLGTGDDLNSKFIVISKAIKEIDISEMESLDIQDIDQPIIFKKIGD